MQELKVLRKLAEGSAAQMFLARDERARSNVLLEIVRPELTNNPEIQGRFFDDTNAWEHQSHPNLIRRKSAGRTQEGRIFVVTEAIAGEHLGDVLKAHGPFSPREVARLIAPLCDAVDFLHGRGRVHGNLCPANVYPGPPVKLVDTGLTLFRSGHTLSKPLILVRPEYLSPERVVGRRCTPLSDIYGMGVLMFELLTGRPPYSFEDPQETRRRHLRADRPDLEGVDEPLASIVLKCLSKQPKYRYPSAEALKEALTDMLSGTGPKQSPALPKGRTTSTLPDATATEEVDIVPAVELGGVETEEEDGSDFPVVQGEPVGDVLGQYELIDVLGQGAMGKVYLAQHSQLGRRVAIKVLKSEFASDPEHLKRFVQEARVVNRINHPHIVEISDFVIDPSGPVYFVMEPLHGESLRDLMKRGPVNIATSVHIVRQVCEALAAAHAMGVVHRDIKPDNIFLTVRGNEAHYVKLLDFGVAKLKGEGEDLLKTRTGVVLGTPAFMAPEQAVGEAVDHLSDLYSLGTVLYTLLKGVRPFVAPSLGVLVARLVTQPPDPLPERSASGELIPPELRAVIFKCLEKKPEARFSSATELAKALEVFETKDSNPERSPASWRDELARWFVSRFDL